MSFAIHVQFSPDRGGRVSRSSRVGLGCVSGREAGALATRARSVHRTEVADRAEIFFVGVGVLDLCLVELSSDLVHFHLVRVEAELRFLSSCVELSSLRLLKNRTHDRILVCLERAKLRLNRLNISKIGGLLLLESLSQRVHVSSSHLGAHSGSKELIDRHRYKLRSVRG